MEYVGLYESLAKAIYNKSAEFTYTFGHNSNYQEVIKLLKQVRRMGYRAKMVNNQDGLGIHIWVKGYKDAY